MKYTIQEGVKVEFVDAALGLFTAFVAGFTAGAVFYIIMYR